jgi:hypothetical protein
MLMIRYALALAAALVLAPMVVFCLFPAVVRVWFEGGPEAVEVDAPLASRPLMAELRRLGFQALGVKVEQMPLRVAIRERAFVAGDRRCYASVAVSAARSRLYYYTPFADGGLVLTSNGAFPKISSTSVSQRSHPGAEAEQLLELHHQALAALGRRAEVVPTTEARVAATYSYYQAPEVRRVLRRTGIFLLVLIGILAWLLIR